jgi:membrane dipeptidase
MKRRDVLLKVAGISLFGMANAQNRIPISDAHNHLGLLRKNKEAVFKLGSLMSEAGVSLLSWTVVPDAPFLRMSASGVEQGRPIAAGELKASFDQQLSNATSGLLGNGVNIVRSVADLDKASNGIPHVVLTSEGADFLEGRLDDLQSAYDRGIRHIQLVHYIKNPIGDLQTESPTHNGLSDFGKKLIRALNTTGILIDLAHSTGPSIDQALEISSQPMIWSHSFITKSEQSWTSRGYMSRGLSEAYAKKIASQGGAVGLWALGPSFGGGLDGYASEIIRMIEILGADHVMFGTDEDGLPQGAVIEQLIDLRKVVDMLAKRGVDEKTLRSVAYGNYARCLRNAML